MAQTTFSGPVVSTNGFTGNLTGDVEGDVSAQSLSVPAYTATDIADVTASLNTSPNKVAGTIIFDSTNSRLMIATGADDDSDWVAGDDSSTTVTPS